MLFLWRIITTLCIAYGDYIFTKLGVLILLALSLLTPYFYFIPQASLAAVTMPAILFMINLQIIKPMWTSNLRRDLVPALTMFLACLVGRGLVLGVMMDVLILLYFNARPHLSINRVQGANSYGQLSHGIQSEQCSYPSETKISSGFEDIISIAAGGGHTLIQDSMGNLFGAGSNSYGQLADCPNNSAVLTKIRSLEDIKITDIACGWESSFFITDIETVVVLGSNKCGQLGISNDKVMSTNHPAILQASNICQVSAGLRHTAMVTRAGQVLVCGQGKRGQLGILGADGKVPNRDYDCLERVANLEGVVQVACGQHHTLALTSDGRVLGWGDNRRGQLGAGPPLIPTPKFITTVDVSDALIRTGWTHSAVLSGGRVASWGRNSYNQLGHSCGVDQVTEINQLISLQGVKQLELGSEHNLALLDGEGGRPGHEHLSKSKSKSSENEENSGKKFISKPLAPRQ